mgnify:CR=1 FL=1
MEDFKPQSVKAPSQDSPQTTETSSLMSEQELAPQGGFNKFKQFYSDNKWYFWAIILGVLIIAGLAAYAFWPREKIGTPLSCRFLRLAPGHLGGLRHGVDCHDG